MKFEKIQSQHSSPKTVGFQKTNKPTFVPPPLGLEVVTMPHTKIFDLYLQGSISAKQMLKMDVNEQTQTAREPIRRQQTRNRSMKRNQADQIFNLVERFQQQRKQSIIVSPSQNRIKTPKLLRKETLMSLTSSTKEIISPLKAQISRFKLQGRKHSQRSSSSGKEEQLIKRCEKLSGERLNEEEKELLLKKDITDDDVWKMMNIFQKKKWFFDYVHRNLDQQQKFNQGNEIKQVQPISLFQKLRNTVLKQNEVKRKPEKQCQEYYTHIQNIEDQIKYQVFNRCLPEQIRNKQKQNVKIYRSESQVEKLNLRNKFLEATEKFNLNQSNPQLLENVFEIGTQTCKPSTKITRQFSRRVQRPSLSRENEISHESQGDSYKSITEFRLNELYHESKQRQKQYIEKFDEPVIDSGDLLQRKVKNLVRIGNLQNTILNVVQFKLQQ